MSATYSITANGVITLSGQLCGAISQGESASATELADGLVFLQVILKGWADKGYKGWLYRTTIFQWVANRASYTIGESAANVAVSRPERIAQAWWQDTNAAGANRTPMVQQAREQFNRLTPVAAQGCPTSWYYDPQIGNGVFYVWPVPTTTNGYFGISVQRPIEDLAGGTGTFDAPQQMYLCLAYVLARDWGILYWRCDERTARRIEARANKVEYDAFDYQEEDASVYFTPNPQFGMYGPRGSAP